MNSTSSFLLLLLLASTLLCVRAILSRDGKTDGETLTESGGKRQNKFFSLFNVVRFPNDVCEGNNDRNGTCYTSVECAHRNGVATTTCALGFGVCCEVSRTCDETTRENTTYFVDPSNLDTAFPCELTVVKIEENICQMRLDFETFVLAGPEGTPTTNPTSYGGCVDQLVVSPNGMGSLCGINTGSHMYVETPGNSDVKLLISMDPAVTYTRQWEILISQIPCGATYAAPPGCTQYYTDWSGTISSYNFQPATATTAHLQEFQQVICIRPYEGFCSISYEAIAFDITEQTSLTLADTCTATDDYIIIPNGEFIDTSTTTPTPMYSDRFCGSVDLTTTTFYPITSSVRPYMVVFISQASDPVDPTAPAGIQGFSFRYTQQHCGV